MRLGGLEMGIGDLRLLRSARAGHPFRSDDPLDAGSTGQGTNVFLVQAIADGIAADIAELLGLACFRFELAASLCDFPTDVFGNPS